jgi:hypothetical protein
VVSSRHVIWGVILIASLVMPGLALAGGKYSEQTRRLNGVYADAYRVTAISPDGKSRALFRTGLGPELRNAEDCETRPGDCFIPALHPEMTQR